jgi:hypothetical protein
VGPSTVGDPEWTRTTGLVLRRDALYPLSYGILGANSSRYHFIALQVLVSCLALLLAVASGVGWAQEMSCAPVPVGEDTGVYFLVLGGSCSEDQAAGYVEVAHLVRDDTSSELLVLVDTEHADDETQAAAAILVNQIKAGEVDGATWHSAAPPE